MRLLQFDPETFRARYNNEPFAFEHTLSEHPLLTWPALEALALRLAEDQVHERIGADLKTNFDAARSPTKARIRSVFESWPRTVAVQLSRPETDAEYKPLIEQLLDEIREYTNELDPTMTYVAAYFFLAGPAAVTPFHQDREMNFFLHLRGPKHLKLWDPHDPVVISGADRELLLGRRGMRVPYRESVADRAFDFSLRPGMGVHHPFIAPHTLTTGDGPSASLAVTFRTKGSDRIKSLYRFNYILKRLGLPSSPIGQRPRLDALVSTAFPYADRISVKLRGKPI